LPRCSHDRAHLHAANPHARVCTPPRFGGRRCAVSHVVAHTYWLRRGASPYRVSVHLLHSGGHLRGSDLPRGPTPCGRSVRRRQDGGGKPALWPACSQNESGGPLILRKARPWHWCACRAPRRLCLPHTFRVSLNQRAARSARAGPVGAESYVAQKLRSRSLDMRLSHRPRGAGCHGDRKRLRHDTQPGLQHIPYSHTAPGDRLVAGSEACLCDGTFSQVWSAYWS
jgi:hypothetical protein